MFRNKRMTTKTVNEKANVALCNYNGISGPYSKPIAASKKEFIIIIDVAHFLRYLDYYLSLIDKVLDSSTTIF